ncbi:MAG: hypothetical protein LBT55_06525 [Clostridiaceae bacterium]|jgi:hypothetical protein|nr:hypothetical protein [Clostridiaceae bacterium]
MNNEKKRNDDISAWILPAENEGVVSVEKIRADERDLSERENSESENKAAIKGNFTDGAASKNEAGVVGGALFESNADSENGGKRISPRAVYWVRLGLFLAVAGASALIIWLVHLLFNAIM